MNQALPKQAPESSKVARHWPAQLQLEFGQQHGRTRLLHSAHRGPLRVQRLFHPEADTGKAHCYLLHPPGGVVLGDDLAIDVGLRSGMALLTTPSAGRFYSVADFKEEQLQRVHLRVDAGLLEWLPQETILFSGARARLHTTIDLATEAKLAFWDVVVLGRPASGERFDRGALEQRLSIRRNQRPLLLERFAVEAGDALSHSRLGLFGASTLGIAVFTAELDEALMDAWLRAVNGDDGVGDFALTQRDELLIARYRGEDAQRCREGFAKLWRRVGEGWQGSVPQDPRIWHT